MKSLTFFTSISSRVAAVSLLLNGLVLLLVGLYLSTSYRADILDRFDRQLEIYGTAILTDLSEVISQGAEPLVRSPDPRFQTPLSGWYWQLARADGTLLYSSRSLFGSSLELKNISDLPAPPQYSHIFLQGADKEDLRLASRGVKFETSDEVLVFSISGDFSVTRQAAANFQRKTFFLLAGIGILLSIGTFVIVRWGLTPLGLIGSRLQDIREGRSARLGPGFADEIAPLAREVDTLLDYNEKLIERAKTHVGNLAHGLKTPLAVLANHAREKGVSPIVKTETQNMQRQVDHHLARARVAATSQILRPVVDVGPVLDRLVRTLSKIHSRVEIAYSRDDTIRFYGDVADFEDLVGNLADNACKWAKSQVWVAAKTLDGNQNAGLELFIEDDGQGLSRENRHKVMQRGIRLDEMTEGSGLGLSIVKDLVDLYDATFEMLDSAHGGLKVRVVLANSQPVK